MWRSEPEIGLKLTIRHHYDFGVDRHIVGDDLVKPEAWDGLRTETTGPFALPETRRDFVQAAEGRADLAERARAIDSWLEGRHVRVLASYGVGAAGLEWLLHVLQPSRELIVTDYAEKTVGRLRTVFPEATALSHDLFDGPLAADMHLFHRVDTELDDDAWRQVFIRFATVPVLVVATEILGAKELVTELVTRVIHRSHATRAGYVRTRSSFETLWASTHSSRRLRVHDLHAWSLEPFEPAGP